MRPQCRHCLATASAGRSRTLAGTLSGDNLGRVRVLLERLDETGRATVAAAHEALFPGLGANSANKALERLTKAINTAARQAGSHLRLVVDPDKKLSTARPLWFEGAREPRQPYDMVEGLEPVHADDIIADTRGKWDRPNVVLLTFNPHERDAVRELFADLGAREPLEENVERLGEIAGMGIVHAHCVYGQGQVSAASITGRMIERHRPLVVIGVGIAMGLKPRQKIGDVMVSTDVRDREMVRINADATVTDRGRVFAIDAAWENHFRGLQLEEHAPPRGLTVHIGRFLCGNPLVDYEVERRA